MADADDNAPRCCPTCGAELVNGARYDLTDPIPVGARVEVSNPKSPVIVGGRIGRFVGYLADGRLEVKLDGGDLVTLPSSVVREMPAPLTVREAG